MPRNGLPPADQAQQLAVTLAPPAVAAAAAERGLCAPRPRLVLTLAPSQPELRHAVDLEALADAHLQPALSQLAPATHVGTRVLHLPPPLPAEQLRWDPRRQAHVLPATTASIWMQHMEAAAWAVDAAHDGSGLAAARVLLFVPPPSHQPLLLELPAAAGGPGGTTSSVQLAAGSLLIIANRPSNSSSRAATADAGSSLEAGILTWLLQPLAPAMAGAAEPAVAARRMQHVLAASCAADAAAALRHLAAAADAAPEQAVSAALSSQASSVMQRLQSLAQQMRQEEERPGQRQDKVAEEALAAAQHTWATAQQLLQDPATGAQPVFPPEHSLAVLLPLALPVTLVLAQAAGREAAAWKQRRRARQQQQQQRPAEAAAGSKEEATAGRGNKTSRFPGACCSHSL